MTQEFSEHITLSDVFSCEAEEIVLSGPAASGFLLALSGLYGSGQPRALGPLGIIRGVKANRDKNKDYAIGRVWTTE